MAVVFAHTVATLTLVSECQMLVLLGHPEGR